MGKADSLSDQARSTLTEAAGEQASLTAPRPTLPDGETGLLGEEIYERRIAPQLEPAHVGEYVAIDVDSGDWALADDLLAASAKLRAEHPATVNIWLIRVGYDVVAGFGAQPSRRVR